ncbi:hypothetical protein ORI20_32745 [Mycobacterium sp. CVI_P3]|uniref:DUF4386 domain-containing protein n=1 Tax=Mycobacterium pinniadriaticum TaxID=2994102 RepID=A0ABT3SPI3_9MYCO|nr:hypothetical protein [Mycobacterium pinniadriaticum]MCX2935027.1 hypothetical protein [Mycobacterium pinniadriaticum]MCX2941449.1 hypothetical protein [Mycobacterium pinniadriaticum]
MNPNIRILGVWSAAAFFLLWLIGFVFFAHWIPPIPPSAPASEIAAMFQARSVPIRIAMVFMSVGTVFYLPWTMVLSDLIKEIEGKSFFLAGTQLAAGVLSAITFFLPAFLWATAAFRPLRNPEITQALVDLGWLFFITPIAPFILQYAILAAAIFGDKRPQPAFPRWAAYLQIWIIISFLPALLAFFMKTGPFAWNGILVWWIPFATFTGWFVTMIALTRRAVLRGATVSNQPTGADHA